MNKRHLIPVLVLITVIPFLIVELDDAFATSDLLTITPITNKTSSSQVYFYPDEYGRMHYASAASRLVDVSEKTTADLYIVPYAMTLEHPALVGSSTTQCHANFERVKWLNAKRVPGFDIPNNIEPNKKNRLSAYGLDFQVTGGGSCSPDPEAASNQPLIIARDMRVTIYDKADKKPFYFSPRDNILDAQPIPVCTTDLIDTNNVLKGNNTVCYGKHGDDMVIITKRLTGFYGAADTVTTPANPINLNPGTQSTSSTSSQLGSTYTHQDYSNMINSTTLTAQNKDIMTQYLSMPKCSQERHKISYTVSMTPDQDVVLKFSTGQTEFDGKVFVIIKKDTGVFSISLPSTFIEERGGSRYYNATISNDLFGDSDTSRLIAFFFETDNTINNKRVYSTSSSGSPLYYNAAPIFYKKLDNGLIIQLPDADSSTNFAPGTIRNAPGTVHLPQGTSVQLSDDVVCQFGVIKKEQSRQIAKIFDLNISATNSSTGIQFSYTFEEKNFASGSDTVKALRPSTIHWIVTASDDTVTRGSTSIADNNATFTISLTAGDYDIILYGTNDKARLIGTHADSYKFTPPVTDPPEQPPQDEA